MVVPVYQCVNLYEDMWLLFVGLCQYTFYTRICLWAYLHVYMYMYWYVYVCIRQLAVVVEKFQIAPHLFVQVYILISTHPLIDI